MNGLRLSSRCQASSSSWRGFPAYSQAEDSTISGFTSNTRGVYCMAFRAGAVGDVNVFNVERFRIHTVDQVRSVIVSSPNRHREEKERCTIYCYQYCMKFEVPRVGSSTGVVI